MKLYFEADQASAKPALLLVHGFLSSRHHWLPNIGALSEHFRTVRVELPGHGLSPAPGEPAFYQLPNLIAELDQIRQYLQLPSWSVCGQSFGAGLTLHYALSQPKVVAAQIFTNANAALGEPFDQPRRLAHQQRIDNIRQFGHAELLRQPYHPVHARRFPASVREQLVYDSRQIDIGAVELLLSQTAEHLNTRAVFANTRVPTLLVNGIWERRFQPSRRWAAEALPDLCVVDCEGGHAVNIECADQFNTAVVEFLQRYL